MDHYKMKRRLKVFKNGDSEFMHEVTYQCVLLCMYVRMYIHSKNVQLQLSIYVYIYMYMLYAYVRISVFIQYNYKLL